MVASWAILALACLGILGAIVAFLKTPQEERYRVKPWPGEEGARPRLQRTLFSLLLFLALAALYPDGAGYFIAMGSGYLVIDLLALLQAKRNENRLDASQPP